ncbi:MBL fold metallo-hydrolase [Aliiglaciecola sp. CAU 1673]|uniref:MBL fold metallo-hydrolase n=1 Tax=Aliiglaciecola sp. CAU 1673 TaxID=3032595 RepID=UPI0023DB551A|nr:MBL fold metallo-hydrolase [Aliiglaciecola sp. CAU 1673]MDF2178307.1 MBL fold metallo-hydrolase [Aliiglaciecola sp. CAU 1673]
MSCHVQHLQSATQILDLNGVRILTDPWLTEGEYHGSWFHYPPFPESKLADLEYDYIYVSHIHPDHLSEKTFKHLPHKKPVIIHKFKSVFLKRKIESFGFEVIECENAEKFFFDSDSFIQIFAADNCDPELCGKFFGCADLEIDYSKTNIDTLALFSSGDKRILNLNDCPFELAKAAILANKLDEEIDLLLVGYAGAGPYPQCFTFSSLEEKKKAIEGKEKQFICQAVNFVKLIRPKQFMPFAGTYILGGKLHTLNVSRGVPNIQLALANIEIEVGTLSQGVLLQQREVLDLNNNSKDASLVLSHPSFDEFMNRISTLPYDYENNLDVDEDVLDENMALAYERFLKMANGIGFTTQTRVMFSFGQDEEYVFSMTESPQKLPVKDIKPLEKEPFVRIALDVRLLDLLLKGPRYAHWNNAEIGSHLHFERVPDVFERGLYHCLYFFHR